MNIDTQSVLARYETCPLCSDTDRDFIPRTEEFSNRYLVALAQYLKADMDDVLAQMLTYKCHNCGTVYCDPWLTPDVCSTLYGAIYGQHRFGWWNFYQWCRNERDYSTGNMKKDVIWRYLSEAAGGIDTYGELNCAFSGFLTEFAFRRADADPEYRSAIARHLVPMRQVYHDFDTFPGYTDPPPPPPHMDGIPDDVYLIIERSPLCWGDNCVHQNTSCHATAAAMFHTRNLSLSDVEHRELEFDVVGAWNILDHFSRPMEVIERLSARSRIVALLTHGAKTILHKQHHYQFGVELPDFLKRQGYAVFEVPEAEIAEDSDDVHNCRAIFLSKQTDFAGLA